MDGEFANRRVVVMGLGRFGGGVGVSEWLARQGAEVLVTDRADEATLAESIHRLAGLGITFHCGRHDPRDLDGADLLVVSPAVDKRKSEFLTLARQRGIPITSEMNLFFERCGGRIIGVTGTTGKSTTCAMLYDVLQAAANGGELGTRRVHLGGNIGRSLLADLDEIGPEDLVVLELSSFQLEDLGTLKTSPPVAVLTNLSPQHLDRHGTLGHYLHCKLNICRYQRAGELVVVGHRAPLLAQAVRRVAGEIGARLVVVENDPGGRGSCRAAPALRLRVLGEHNRRNAAVAAQVAAELGVRRPVVLEALAGFRGLPHRLQWVRRVEGVDYYNDSKATTPEALAAALSSFDRPVTLIAGGADRSVSWGPVTALREAQIQAAVCLGQTAGMLADLLHGTAVTTLEEAVRTARRLVKEGDVVLFSPGCPSYDQFVNYEARGEAFVKNVNQLG